MREFLEILKYRLVSLNVVLIILSAALMFLIPFLSVVTFMLLINLYDILGYHFTLIRRTTQLPPIIFIRAYRIHQFLYEVLLILFIGLLFNPKYSIACIILKWFGLQDILYYLFLQKEIPDKFTWMKWTPFGFIKGDLSKFEVIFQVTIGIIIAILIIIL